jgi:hypothetical protein
MNSPQPRAASKGFTTALNAGMMPASSDLERSLTRAWLTGLVDETVTQAKSFILALPALSRLPESALGRSQDRQSNQR